MKENEFATDAKVGIEIEYLQSVNYSMMNSGVSTCSQLIIENNDTRDWHQLVISISGQYIKESSCMVDQLPCGQSVQVSSIAIQPDIQMLSEITEAVNTTFVMRIEEAEGTLTEAELPIALLAYDEWAGTQVMPEHLASFVIPNNPILARVKMNAARFLEEWTGSASFDEYQTQDRNRVRAQVAAFYEALRSEGIVYSAPPASFGQSGQRIRLADKVLTEKIGTCIDTSLLMATCLESVGIYPIVILLNGHAMVGAWLTPTVFPQMVCDDASYLLKQTADGNNNLVVLESTYITSSAAVSFEEAVKSALQKLADDRKFLFFIDIHRCRLAHISPLPQRIMKDGVWYFETEGIEHENATENVVNYSHFDLRLEGTGQPMTKQMLWERKLLDFSLRNNLINTRLGKRVIPFISFEIEHIEDRIQNNEDYHIVPSPGKKIEPNQDGMYDSCQQAMEHRALVLELTKENQIASYLTEAELIAALKNIHRTARTSLEENGANSLFLTLGMLKWYETDKSIQPRYAPILLLPVDIVRKSANKYVIRKRDEDIILNITLVELLKQHFNINLDGLNVLPKDKSGVDVKLIFTYIRRAIIAQKRWNVIEESLLGLFSFNKFVMWNDIHTNAELLKQNVIVSSLMDGQDNQGAVEDPVDARHIDKENEPKDFAIPLDVDSSQMEAIVESGRGHSFILHGPPGTGKSQTITNMIANALYHNRRVLFVAEKMAALSVVQDRLEKVGLAPFCMELHSNKATKKHFLEQLNQVVKITDIHSPEEFNRKSDQLFNERQKLISYMEALHQKSANGMSLYQCISAYLELPDEEVTEGLPQPEDVTIELLEQCYGQTASIQAVLSIVGTPSVHGLYGLEPIDNKQSTLTQIFALLREIRNHTGQFERQLSAFRDFIPMELESEADMEWLRMFCDYVQQKREHEELRQQICSSFSEDILNIQVDIWEREWAEIQDKWFLSKMFGKKDFMKKLSQYGQVFESGVNDLLGQVRQWQGGEHALEDKVEEMAGFARMHAFSHSQRQHAFDRWADGQFKTCSKEFLMEADYLLDAYGQIEDTVSQFNELTLQRNTFADIFDNSDRWLTYEAEMKDWYHWVDKKREMLELGMDAVVTRIETGMPPRRAINAFLKGIYHQFITQAIDENPQLRMFDGMKFRQQVAKYKQDTREFQELTKQELFCKIASRIPSMATDNPEITFLKRNIANGGRGNSIRTILDNIPTLFPQLCPCMLMSPMSVAQYIDLNAEKFDLVVFDEASQMPTSEAIGAIARGKAVIVVGDSKQMPPTSFFATTQVDEEEADIDDMESILDDCITLSLNEHRLNWHYRSKHESLIAFSNSQYYDNGLLTFPSTDDHQAKVRLVQVEGVYDKGNTRSNPAESKAIVDEVIRRLSDPELSKFSIGVVSFSKVQGDRIEDDLTEALDKHPELKELAYNSAEPIFVKNLENVQGDERDVILFSVGYGADKDGKVSMNFGPLNNNGGERRLNVAVSRARYEMMVFSTLRASQIDLKRSQAKGVIGLKGFLEFAETGRLPLTAEAVRKEEQNVMVRQICDELTARGYLTDQSVGRSNFKVDIAVSKPEQPDHYVLGILCDGRNYYETKTTRDREIVQPTVLNMLNWRILRVYSIDWYNNRQRALSQMIEALETPEHETKPEEPAAPFIPKTTFTPEEPAAPFIPKTTFTPEETLSPEQSATPEDGETPRVTSTSEMNKIYQPTRVRIVRKNVETQEQESPGTEERTTPRTEERYSPRTEERYSPETEERIPPRTEERNSPRPVEPTHVRVTPRKTRPSQSREVPKPEKPSQTSKPQLQQHRFCTNCGSPLLPEALFCTKCGKKVK